MRIILMLPVTRSRALSSLVGAAASALLLAGCGGSGDASGSGHRAVASHYPLAWATEQVAGNTWEVTNLTKSGEPHDLEIGIAQTAEIEQADLVVLESGFQPALDAAVKQNSDAPVIDAAQVIELRPLEDHGHEGDHEGHDHGDVDPHFWLDPLLLADFADAVATALGKQDPDNAKTYAANAAALRKKLEALDNSYATTLASCTRDQVVVSHDAFGYLTRYGLHFESIAGLSPEAEPTAAGLAALQKLINEEGITTVFSETLASPKMSETLAADAGVTTAVLDPIEGLSDQTADQDYLSLMESNLKALVQANDCS